MPAGTIGGVNAGGGDGFLTQMYSPAAKFVGASSLFLISEGDRLAVYHGIKQQLASSPMPQEFTIAVPGFVPTTVSFRSLATAAMAMFGRARDGATAPALM